MKAKLNYLFTLLNARACRLYDTFFKVLNNAIFDLLGSIFIALALVLKAILVLAYVSLPLFAILSFVALIFKLF